MGAKPVGSNGKGGSGRPGMAKAMPARTSLADRRIGTTIAVVLGVLAWQIITVTLVNAYKLSSRPSKNTSFALSNADRLTQGVKQMLQLIEGDRRAVFWKPDGRRAVDTPEVRCLTEPIKAAGCACPAHIWGQAQKLARDDPSFRDAKNRMTNASACQAKFAQRRVDGLPQIEHGRRGENGRVRPLIDLVKNFSGKVEWHRKP